MPLTKRLNPTSAKVGKGLGVPTDDVISTDFMFFMKATYGVVGALL
jgi:hypothetical protein